LIDEAIALEERAENNYRSAAETTSDAGAKKILALLADEEARHVNVLRTMNVGALQSEFSLIDAAMDWVGGAIEGGAASLSADGSLRDALKSALEMERVTEAFYRERAESTEDAAIAALFERLAGIEKAHYLFVGSLVEYYDRPAEWVESAEFGLRDEY
ncbi:ferritin family protein, partial [Candidatus Bipolaricaulota bacterium]|nr:ferritin family protein [Candidatus Bipolaricaulota bacterium]